MGTAAPADLECDHCHERQTQVIDSRGVGGRGQAIRRRRECLRCGFRFTSYETKESPAARRAFTQAMEAFQRVLRDEKAS